MKRLILFIAVLTVITDIAMAQTVQLDPEFGNNGIVTTFGTTEINKTLLTHDNKILSLGYYHKEGIGLNYDWVLAKYNLDGSLDNDFGVNGLVFNADEETGFPLTMVIQTDGKILVVGNKYFGHIEIAPDVWAGVYKSFLVRYEANGDIDTTFGDNGLIIMDFNSRSSAFSSIALLNNNQIIVGGSVGSTTIILKFNSDGTVDESFADSGILVFDDPEFFFLISDFLLLHDETLLCYGSDFLGYDPYFWEPLGQAVILKLDTDGKYIMSFGNDGKIILENESYYGLDNFSKAIESDNGQLLLAGHLEDPILLKLNADGSINTHFGDQGFVFHSYPFTDMVIRNDGKIYMGGNKNIASYDYGYSVCCFNADGSFDNSFNNSIGHFDLNISDKNDYLQCMNIQSDGKLLLSGSSKMNEAANFTLARLIVDYPNNIEEIDANNNISVFPNPFCRYIRIQSSDEAIKQVIIYDLKGQIVHTQECAGNEVSIALNIPQGIYTCAAVLKNGKRAISLIIRE